MKGYIHSFESLAALDGAGLRYAVFFAGCPLRCVCCHNPDTWEMAGEEIGSEELVNKISRYKPYFKADGGVTFSGGEPMLQAEFINEMIPMLEASGINYAIDTSGAVKLDEISKNVYNNAQMVLLDLKFWDDESYKKYTGIGMENTLNTLKYLDSIGKRTWIRTVVIPNINDSEDVISKYIPHIKDLKCVEKYELLAFHTMGFFKYEKLGIKNPLLNTPPLEIEVKNKLQTFVNNSL